MQAVDRFRLVMILCGALCVLPGRALAEDSVSMLRTVGFAEGAFVRPAVKTECNLEDRLPLSIQEFARKNGIEIQLVDALPSSGRVLEVAIADAIESGNFWMGRQKGLVIQGRLLEDGAVVGSFRGRRMTSGGFFGGYKGACAFFGRCAKTLGHDVAEWLKSPGKDSSLGG